MRSTRTIQLPSGASLTISIDANLFDLAPGDRDLVFGIFDDARRFVEAVEAKVLTEKEVDRG